MGGSSETEECQVIETTIHTDKDWVKNLEPKELEYYQSNQISIEVLEDRRVHCTACYEQGNHKQKGFFVRHPTLGVPICKACKSYYFEGSWRKDEDGKFEYCGWCAQGGDLLCCAKSSCPNAFCLKCVKRNLGRKSVTKIEEADNWECFECKPFQLKDLRLLYYSILQFWQHFDDKLKAKEAKKALKKENCISKSISETKTTLHQQINLLSKINCQDKLGAAEKYAKFVALSKKNLDQLQGKFFDHLRADLGEDEERDSRLLEITTDLKSVTNGHLKEAFKEKKEKVGPKSSQKVKEEVSLIDSADDLEKEKVKYEVLKSSDEEEEEGAVNGCSENNSSSKKIVPQSKKGRGRPPKAEQPKDCSSDSNLDNEEDSPAVEEPDSDFDYKAAAVPDVTPKKKKKSKKDPKYSSDEEEKSVKEKKEKVEPKSQKIKEDVLKESSDDLFEKSEDEDQGNEIENKLAKPNLEKDKKSPDSKKEIKSSPPIKAKVKIGPKRALLKAGAKGDEDDKENVQKSAKEAVLATSSEDNDSDDILSDTEEKSAAKKLRKTFDQLIEKIDIKTDSKLHNSNVEVVVEKLDIQLDDNNSVTLPDCTKEKKKKSQINETKEAKREGAKFDAEISKLCDLGALNKLTKTTKESEKLAALGNGKMKNGARKKSSREATKDSDIEELTSGSDVETKPARAGKETLRSVKDRAKEVVLATSESDMSDAEKTNKKRSSKKDSKSNGNSKSDKKRKSRKDPDFMKVKLDATDSDEEEEKSKRRREKAKKKVLEESDDDDVDQESPSKKGGRNRRQKAKVASDFEDEIRSENESDDDDDDEKMEEENSKSEDLDEDSDIGTKKKVAKGNKKKRKKKSSSSSSGETSDDEPRPKKKRRRIKKNDSSGDEEKKEDGEENESPSKAGRKDIRKIMKDKKLSESTKEAAELERARRKRVEEKQALYNEMNEIKDNAVVKEVLLDVDSETKEVLVQVHPQLCSKLKPHQARGIKFMWDSVFESKKDVEAGNVPGGAILAHCMGLGKTLQSVSLVHTVAMAFPEKTQKSLVLAPVNTLKNWEDEFYKWLNEDLEDDLEVYEISGEKDMWGRADRIRHWGKNGGVLIMGYDMYRNLTNEKKKLKKKQREIFMENLVDPGPDLVICDEGHVLKNTKSALNQAMNKVKTRRRVILTGTPLQNNLSEYFAMVDFVKPKLLGTYNEFRNRFVNPITNGQSSDSTERDVRIMKKRSFILNDLLKGCMQRLDYNVLVPFLQPKHEYVLCICLTEFQKKLYKHYLENYAKAGQIGSDGKLEGGKKGGLFYDVQNLSRVWNHPYILLRAKERSDIAKMMQDDIEEDEKFINDSDGESDAKSTSEASGSGSESEVEEVKRRRVTRGVPKGDNEKLMHGLDEAKADYLASERGWWGQFMNDPHDEEELLNIELGSKMVLLMDILKECYLIGDKVLVFSQSLLSLDLIETFLQHANTDLTFGSWLHGKDYYRMDGSTAPDIRKRWCSYFNNKKNNDMRLFLISTKAGGLGINLVAANRVIIFDASWNPAHDVQSIFRVYRFGQEKPVYIYRFLAKGTMEEKIYDRQVTKQSLSARVVDEQQIERHFTMNELAELYTFNDEPKENQPTIKVPQDKLLAELVLKHKDNIWKIHDHDSLLENQVDEHLTEEERKAAWDEFENEKKGIINMTNSVNLNQNLVMSQINPEMIRTQYRLQYPHLTEEQINQATRAYMMQIQSGFTGKLGYDKSHYAQEMARARAQQQQLYPGMYGSGRGARPAESVSNSDLVQQAKQLQMLQQIANAQRAIQQQQLANRQASNNVTMTRVTMKKPSILNRGASKPARVTETITLDEDEDPDEINEVELDDDDDDDDAGEIVLDGAPEVADYEYQPSTSSRSSRSRRGRPRLDPDTDPL